MGRDPLQRIGDQPTIVPVALYFGGWMLYLSAYGVPEWRVVVGDVRDGAPSFILL